jgi:hypothetical protein
MFNAFLNNNNNNSVPVDKKLMVNVARFLTNDERVELKKNINNGKNINSKMNAMVKRKLNSVNMSKFSVSPLKLGFFNAIVNDKFDKKERIDLVKIFNKKPHGRKSIPRSSLDIEIKSIKLYFGQFKVGAEHSLSGKFGEIDPKKKYFMAQISAHVYDGKANQGITFRVYRNGKIHFSGGILNNNIKQPEQIRKYIVDTFTERESFLYSPIMYNNTTGQFDVKGSINLSGVVKAFRLSTKIDYEPELRAALRMDYLGTSLQLFTTGIIQVLGVRTEEEMLQAYNMGVDLATQLYVLGLIVPSGGNAKSIVKKKQKKVVASNKNVSNITYNLNKNKVKVSKKLCTRLPKPELVAAAKKIGVVDIKSTTTKDKICDMIKARVFGNFKVENKPCLAYTKAKLTPLAIAKGVTVTDADTVKTICEKLQAPPPKQKNVAKAKATAKAAAKVNTTMQKRRLTNNTIKENLRTLYGKRWLNKYENVMPSLNENVADIKKRINALNVKRNKKGIPFKSEANAVKKMSVREWKFTRKKMLNNKLNALNNNFANELEKLLNVEIVEPKKKKKKFPKGTKVEQL